MSLGMGIIDGKLLLCCDISDKIREKNITTIEYNYRSVYDCFNNTFPDDYGAPAMNIPPHYH